MSTCYRMAHRADTDDPDGPIRFVVATEGRKADGIDLRMDRADLARYESNPVVLAFHDYWQLPVGRGENVTIEDGKLYADAVFDLDDPLGAQLDRKYRNGFMSAVSVGFDVYDVDDAGVPGRWEMLEFSAVPIPLDADAIKSPDRQARALVGALTDLRAGKVLSKSNEQLVEQAVEALSAVLEAAREDAEDDDRGAAGPSRLQAARRRLALHEATA